MLASLLDHEPSGLFDGLVSSIGHHDSSVAGPMACNSPHAFLGGVSGAGWFADMSPQCGTKAPFARVPFRILRHDTCLAAVLDNRAQQMA